MKLSQLNSAIRAAEKVSIWTRMPGGPLLVVAQKTSLLEALKALHGGVRTAETGMYVREDGQLMAENKEAFAGDPADQDKYEAQRDAVEAVGEIDLDDDLDDLLGDSPVDTDLSDEPLLDDDEEDLLA